MATDITKDVNFDSNSIDGEMLPLRRYKCGQEFKNWEFILSRGVEGFQTCPNCGISLWFEISIRIYTGQEE